MSLPTHPPPLTSHRQLFQSKLSNLHNNPSHLKQLHSQLFKLNLHSDPFIAPKLIHSYSLSRQISSAVKIFEQFPDPTTLLFNTLIRAFIHNSLPHRAFLLFLQMQHSVSSPDNFTYQFLLKACSGSANAIRKIKMIHNHIVKLGLLSDKYMPNSLIDSYSKNGTPRTAKRVFDEMADRDTFSWNSMIGGFVRGGELSEAWKLFNDMPDRDVVSWNTILLGFTKGGDMDKAFELFERMPERNKVSWSTMVSGYCKMGDIDMARIMFDKMPTRKDLVPWTIIISGYAGKGLEKEALLLLNEMEELGLVPDDAAVVSILAACAESGLLRLGERIRLFMEKKKLSPTAKMCNSLIDMYSKCGCLDKASSVFEGMVERNFIAWNSMICSLASQGQGANALRLFDRMKEEGFEPDGVTFVGVLCACADVGLVEEGRGYFASMKKDYRIVPQIEHYGCMIDLLGCGGLLQEAFELAETMPFKPNAIIWGTLLKACKVHNNVGLAEEAVDHLIRLDPSDSDNYSVLSNIYAAAGRWNGMAETRILMKGIQKQAGSSWTELDDSLHEFTIADRSHHQTNRIFKMVDRLGQHLRQVGYVL